MEKQYFIYMTTNLVNGNKYIGKHYGKLDDEYLGSGKLIKRAIEKYGKENFVRIILDYSKTEEENCEKEKYYIALYNATERRDFYNIHEGGNGGNTTKGYTKEEKDILSRKISERTSGINNPMYGVKRSQKYKDKMSYWATNIRDNSVYQTPEFRQKISTLTAGQNNGMYGKKHSDESKKKMSEHHQGLATGSKNGMYGKSGEDAINGKHIRMYDINHVYIRDFPSKRAALTFLGLTGHTQLDKAIKNHTSYKNYYWIQI